jgi:hydroxyethylthiazole kinase-like uncharacterized protein yjeF
VTARSILTADEMRAAKATAIAAGTAVDELMERAGAAAAEAVWRYAGPLPTLVLCGPGNNGGDGYVIARCLAERGVDVRVAAFAEPKSDAARNARRQWTGPVTSLEEVGPAPLLVDALFGTGLARGLDAPLVARLAVLAEAARIRVAVDLPSGIATDDGSILSPVPHFDLTVTFATLKPSHRLQPAARFMGRVAIADIGIRAESRLSEISAPALREPGPDDHKYSRGYVLVVGGAMPGAAALAASAAARSGAGYVVLVGEGGTVPNAVIQKGFAELEQALGDSRVDCVLVGPGLGRDSKAAERLDRVLRSPHPVVLDGDALWLIAENGISKRGSAILTPHAGEFERLFGEAGDRLGGARRAAEQSGMTIVSKGPDTIVAEPGGRAAIASAASHWLSTAGTGDVLAGIVAAIRASGLDDFEAACAGVWLHGQAAERAGSAFIADDLLARLAIARASCR